MAGGERGCGSAVRAAGPPYSAARTRSCGAVEPGDEGAALVDGAHVLAAVRVGAGDVVGVDASGVEKRAEMVRALGERDR